jgi:hypothetical protein
MPVDQGIVQTSIEEAIVFPNDQSVEELLAQPADAVLEFVRQHKSAIDGSLPWQELAEGAKNQAMSRADSPDALTWAATAVMLYDRLGERCDEPRTRAQCTNAAMSLRAEMLNAHGPQSAHLVLDPMNLEAWFFRSLEWRYEKVARMMQNEDELSSDEFQSLKRLKERTRILQSVRSQDWFQRGDELALWYGLISG